MKNFKHIKNYLNKEDFNNLKNNFISNSFPWYLSNVIKEDKNIYQFVHMFYIENKINSNFFYLIEPILKKINPVALIKIKANLITKTSKNIEHGMHTDINPPSSKITTAIFYCNTNNGYTKFENKTKIKSIENSFISFDSNVKHTGSSCTDKEMRIVINFNYIT